MIRWIFSDKLPSILLILSFISDCGNNQDTQHFTIWAKAYVPQGFLVLTTGFDIYHLVISVFLKATGHHSKSSFECFEADWFANWWSSNSAEIKTESRDWRMSWGRDLYLDFLYECFLNLACLRLSGDWEHQNYLWYIHNIMFLYIHKIFSNLFFLFLFFLCVCGYEAGYLLFSLTFREFKTFKNMAEVVQSGAEAARRQVFLQHRRCWCNPKRADLGTETPTVCTMAQMTLRGE